MKILTHNWVQNCTARQHFLLLVHKILLVCPPKMQWFDVECTKIVRRMNKLSAKTFNNEKGERKEGGGGGGGGKGEGGGGGEGKGRKEEDLQGNLMF